MLCSKSIKHKRVYSLTYFFINLFIILMQLFIYQFIHLYSSIHSVYLFDSLIYFKYEECNTCVINTWGEKEFNKRMMNISLIGIEIHSRLWYETV